MKSGKQKPKLFCPESREEWREWLHFNHELKQFVWLVYYKKKAGKKTLKWTEAVDEALCYGWIDSISKPIDNEKYMQFFSKRKANSTWSKINKDKIERLHPSGLIAPAGLKCIEIAKQNGSWQILDEVENLIIPADLASALATAPDAEAYFSRLSKSVTKAILQWIVLARRPETRSNRIAAVLQFTTDKNVPKQFRP